MDRRLRSLLTLAGLGVLLVVATLWGWSAATKPLPELADVPLCVDTAVEAGAEVFPDQVVVSVHNASQTNGLASKTMTGLVERGFVTAGTGNAPADAEVGGVQIWADDPKDPAVALVRKQFRRATVQSGPELGLGVVVVVGDGFKSLRPARKAASSVVAQGPATICSPPGALS